MISELNPFDAFAVTIRSCYDVRIVTTETYEYMKRDRGWIHSGCYGDHISDYFKASIVMNECDEGI